MFTTDCQAAAERVSILKSENKTLALSFHQSGIWFTDLIAIISDSLRLQRPNHSSQASCFLTGAARSLHSSQVLTFHLRTCPKLIPAQVWQNCLTMPSDSPLILHWWGVFKASHKDILITETLTALSYCRTIQLHLFATVLSLQSSDDIFLSVNGLVISNLQKVIC